MISIHIDIRDFEDAARRMQARVDQVPFALSRALNDALFDTREKLATETWPRSVQVRNPRFLDAALRVSRSDKHNLTGMIYDALGRGHLAKHADGGTKQAISGRLAIPIKGNVRYTTMGPVPKPRALVAMTPRRALRITRTGIFVGESGRLKLMYKLQPTAQIKPDVPFRSDFARFMLERAEYHFSTRMAEAMKTAR